MGNNMGVGSSKAAKVMNINGEFFKIKSPTKVLDVIKDYPDHILLDSEEFLRFKLRAKPLNQEDELKPRKIYLLVELPRFPDEKFNDINNQSPLRKVRSGVLKTKVTRDLKMMKGPQRSVSDLAIMTRSMAARSATDSNDGGSLGDDHVGPTRVKMRLPKGQVQKIMEENEDDLEVARKIVRLCLEENAAISGGNAAAEVEERGCKEEAEMERHCLNVHVRSMFSPCSSYRRKYKKLSQ